MIVTFKCKNCGVESSRRTINKYTKPMYCSPKCARVFYKNYQSRIRLLDKSKKEVRFAKSTSPQR